MATFTVDWETWFNAVEKVKDWRDFDLRINEPTLYLLDLLDKYDVKAIFYILGWLQFEKPRLVDEIQGRGHLLGSHGHWHGHNETRGLNESEIFRSPYWDTTPMPWPPSGGFFFRAMPYSYVKWAVNKSGIFWIHPHDLDEGHPRLKNPVLNWKRHIGLKTASKKLERLISEIKWDEPK